MRELQKMNNRLIEQDDVEAVLAAINGADKPDDEKANYTATILCGAYTGQRPQATIAKLTVGQFREALEMKMPVLTVAPEQDKNHREHYVPLHPNLVNVVEPLQRAKPMMRRFSALKSCRTG